MKQSSLTRSPYQLDPVDYHANQSKEFFPKTFVVKVQPPFNCQTIGFLLVVTAHLCSLLSNKDFLNILLHIIHSRTHKTDFMGDTFLVRVKSETQVHFRIYME